MKLEVIAANLSDIKIINQSNADRIEFCTNLEVGGLSPAKEDIVKALKVTSKPINIMVRPTERDFCYTDSEFEEIVKEIKFINLTKANGIVVGILKDNNDIDIERMEKVMKLTNKKVTFHKAFDLVKDKQAGLDILQKLGVDTVLTSAGAKITDNLDTLLTLKQKKTVTILAGGGICAENIDDVKTKVNQIHVGTMVRQDNSWSKPIIAELINEVKERIS